MFKQNTAYDISECDWSSDVCSSDLMEYQIEVFKKRKEILTDLKNIPNNEMGEKHVKIIEDRLNAAKEEAKKEFEKFSDDFIKIQNDKKNEAIEIAQSLKEFLESNNATLISTKTFQSIIEEECNPIIELRFEEGKQLLDSIRIGFYELDDTKIGRAHV